MKHLSTLLAAAFVLVFAASCKKMDHYPHQECKLVSIDRGTGNTHAYTYNTAGKVASMAREFVAGPGTTLHFNFEMNYNSSGQLSNVTADLNGSPYGNSQFVYNGGRLTRVNYSLADGTNGMNNITYNASGLISSITDESGTPNDIKQYFEYNNQDIMTKRGMSDLAGNIFFEIRTNPVGFAKIPEQLLIAHGLPYDLLTGMPWQVAGGRQGTTGEIYEADPNTGNLVLVANAATTGVTLGPRGFIVAVSGWEGSPENSFTSSFVIEGCD